MDDSSLSSICFLGFSSRSVFTAPVSDNLHSSSGRETREVTNLIHRMWLSIQKPGFNFKVSNLRPTFNFEVHAPEDQGSDELGLHLALKIDKDGGQVAVGVVRDAGGGDGLEELGLGELPGQGAQVLVDQGTQRDAEKQHEWRGRVDRPVSAALFVCIVKVRRK